MPKVMKSKSNLKTGYNVLEAIPDQEEGYAARRVSPDDLSLLPPRPKGWNDKEEAMFQSWYKDAVYYLSSHGQKLDPDPDNPLHRYDYRGAFRADAVPEYTEHGDFRWPDEFKLKGHKVPGL